MQQNILFDENAVSEPDWITRLLEMLGVITSPGWPDEFGSNFRKWIKSRKEFEPVKTLSLFSGGGGLDIAFHDMGFEIVECVEIEKKFTDTLVANTKKGKRFFESKINCMDIREYDPPSTLDIDFIIGGPPCQTFSAAGARAAGVTGLDDQRGNLFEEYVRLLRKLKPRGFLFENVYRIVGAQSGRPWKRIREAFQQAGYKIFWRILDSADYGVPQHRERLFIVGLRDGSYEFPYPTHGPDSRNQKPFYTAGMALDGLKTSIKIKGLGGRHGHLLEDIPPGLNYSFYTQKMGFPRPIFAWRSKFSDYLYKADPEMPVRTIKAQGGQYTGPFSWESRPFTIQEMKRLQSFPDDYEISGNRQVAIMQLGNSVPPQIGRILALSILENVFRAKFPFNIEYLPNHTNLNFRARKRLLTARYKEKAGRAIEVMTNSGKFDSTVMKMETDGNGTCFLNQNFQLNQTTNENNFAIQYRYKLTPEAWRIDCQKKGNKYAHVKFGIEIVLNPEQQNILYTKKVILSSYTTDRKSLPSIWKIFEKLLTECTGKDDLVQLFGYYQYKSRYMISMKLESQALTRDKFWSLIGRVTNGLAVGEILPIRDISEVYGISQSQFSNFMREIKSLGYEIRNKNTNPQFNHGEYLIPYSFPSLNPRSLQLLTKL